MSVQINMLQPGDYQIVLANIAREHIRIFQKSQIVILKVLEAKMRLIARETKYGIQFYPYLMAKNVCECVFSDYVSIPVQVLVNNKILVTSGEYNFYNCSATVRKNPNTP